MKAEIIESFVAARLKQLGRTEKTREMIDISLTAESTERLDCTGSLAILIDSPSYVEISSEYGSYGIGNRHVHEHTGMVEVKNSHQALDTRVCFLRIYFNN